MENTQFCSHCGAANSIERELCFACHHPLDAVTDEADSSPALLGRYRLIEQIGSGGFGAVYKALDTAANDALIAIKQVNLKGLSPQEIIEATSAFNREVELLSSLSHPQLPHIYDQFSDPEHWYVVMDYIEGQTLEAYLQEREGRRKPLTVLEALDIALQLCHVLRYLHTRQPPIIFRDLKPDNVMRTPRGELFLIDFGIARHFKPGQKRDTIPLGSPGYAAPEQYGRAQTTPQADIYSLGALLHRMLSQIEPSERPLTFVPLTLPGLEVNNALNMLLRRMQALISTERPQSIREVEYELRHIKQLQIEAEGVRIWSPTQPVPAPPLKPGQQPLYIPSGSRQQFQMQQQQQRTALSRRQALIAGAAIVSGLTIFGGMISPAFRPLPFRGRHRPPDFDKQGPNSKPPTSKPSGRAYWSSTLQQVAYVYPGTRTVMIYDAQTQATVNSFQVDVPDPQVAGQSLELYWSVDDKQLFTVADGHYLQVWSIPDGESSSYNTLPEQDDALTAAWSADGTYIATGGRKNVIIWPTTYDLDNHPAQQAFFPSLDVNLLAWSPGNKYLAFTDAVSVEGSGTIGIWDVVRNQHMRDIAKPATAESPDPKMLWSSLGSWIAYATGGDSLWILDPVNTNTFMLCVLASTFFGMAWSRDGSRLAIGQGQTVEIWSVADRQLLQVSPGPENQPKAIGWSLDGKNILVGDASGQVESWPFNP